MTKQYYMVMVFNHPKITYDSYSDARDYKEILLKKYPHYDGMIKIVEFEIAKEMIIKDY